MPARARVMWHAKPPCQTPVSMSDLTRHSASLQRLHPCCCPSKGGLSDTRPRHRTVAMNRDSTEMLLNSYPILYLPVPSFLTVNSDTFRLPHQPHATYHLYKRSKLSSRRLLVFAHIAPSILARYLGTYCGLFTPPSPPDHQYSLTLTSHEFSSSHHFSFLLALPPTSLHQTHRKKFMLHTFQPADACASHLFR